MLTYKACIAYHRAERKQMHYKFKRWPALFQNTLDELPEIPPADLKPIPEANPVSMKLQKFEICNQMQQEVSLFSNSENEKKDKLYEQVNNEDRRIILAQEQLKEIKLYQKLADIIR